jgi:hemolysin III
MKAFRRPHSRRELIADLCVHVAGLSFGAVGAATLIVLALRGDDPLIIAGLAIYAVGLAGMLGFSALYHLAHLSPRTDLYRRLDHAAIYILIVSTLTPFALNEIGSPLSVVVVTVAWLAAGGGVALTLFSPRRQRKLSVGLYLLLGWVAFVALNPMMAEVSRSALILLAVGGLFYSVGVLFHLWRRLPYQNAIWHVCVLAGAGCHYAAVLGEFILGGSSL